MAHTNSGDAVALAVDHPIDNEPADVVIHHRQHGIGTETLEHRVEIRDNASGALLADYPATWAALWLRNRGYSWVIGSNGLWRR
jgi:hypothetical protein